MAPGLKFLGDYEAVCFGYRFKKATSTTCPAPVMSMNLTACSARVKGRVGMEMGGILPYLTAGVTASQLKTNAIGYAERNGTAVGGIVGAGVTSR